MSTDMNAFTEMCDTLQLQYQDIYIGRVKTICRLPFRKKNTEYEPPLVPLRVPNSAHSTDYTFPTKALRWMFLKE